MINPWQSILAAGIAVGALLAALWLDYKKTYKE